MYQKITAYLVHFMVIFSMLSLYIELIQMVQYKYYLTGLFTIFFGFYIYFTVTIYKVGENLRQLNEKLDDINEQFEN